MLEATLTFGKEKVLVIGTFASIKRQAAERLDCDVDKVTFKIQRDGEMRELLASSHGMSRLIQQKEPIFVSAKKTGRKRKADDSSYDSGVESSSSSIRLVPRKQTTTTPRPSKSTPTLSAAGSTSRLASVTTARTTPLVRNRKNWSTKEDRLLWKRFMEAIGRLPPPIKLYSIEQRDAVFTQLAASFPDRTPNALLARVRNRIANATSRKEILSERIQKLFPVSRLSRQAIFTTDDEEMLSGNESLSSLSSVSDPTPPPMPNSAMRRVPVRINDHDPFAGKGIPIRQPHTRASEPTQSTVVPSATSLVPSEASKTRTAPSVATAPSQLVVQRTQKHGEGLVPITVSSDDPSVPLVHPSDLPSASSARSTSATRPFVARHSNGMINNRHLASPDTTAVTSTAEKAKGRPADIDVVIVKDEEDEETGDGTASRLADLTMSGTKESACRAVCWKHLHAVLPVTSITLLPLPSWGMEMAAWIRQNVLEEVAVGKARINILKNCLDEFFWVAYTYINPDFTVIRASCGAALLFLDFYYTLLDMEELFDALVELLLKRCFTDRANSLPTEVKRWPAFEIFAALACILPTRPYWLVTEVLRRSDDLAIDTVPPPQAEVIGTFKRVKLLLDKITQCRQRFEHMGASAKPFLLISTHEAGLSPGVVNNLRVLYRQSQGRLQGKPELKTIEDALAKVERFNQEARDQDKRRKIAEEDFFQDRLLLVSSVHPLGLAQVEELLMTYSLRISGSNGPLEKKLFSTNEMWHLWILQFSDRSARQAAILRLQSMPEHQEVQVLHHWRETHSWCRNTDAQAEQKDWHRSSSELQLHRQYHHLTIHRIKKEVTAAAAAAAAAATTS